MAGYENLRTALHSERKTEGVRPVAKSMLRVSLQMNGTTAALVTMATLDVSIDEACTLTGLDAQEVDETITAFSGSVLASFDAEKHARADERDTTNG